MHDTQRLPGRELHLTLSCDQAFLHTATGGPNTNDRPSGPGHSCEGLQQCGGGEPLALVGCTCVSEKLLICTDMMYPTISLGQMPPAHYVVTIVRD